MVEEQPNIGLKGLTSIQPLGSGNRLILFSMQYHMEP